MKYLFGLLLLPSLIFAQWPGTPATDQQLLNAANGASGYLASAIGPADSTVTLTTSVAAFVPNSIITIDAEQMQVCSIAFPSSLVICAGGRGYDGTTAVSHSTNATVGNYAVAAYHNRLRQEIETLETGLKADISASQLNGQSIRTFGGSTGALLYMTNGIPRNAVRTDITGLWGCAGIMATDGTCPTIPAFKVNNSTTVTPNLSSNSSVIFAMDGSGNITATLGSSAVAGVTDVNGQTGHVYVDALIDGRGSHASVVGTGNTQTVQEDILSRVRTVGGATDNIVGTDCSGNLWVSSVSTIGIPNPAASNGSVVNGCFVTVDTRGAAGNVTLTVSSGTTVDGDSTNTNITMYPSSGLGVDVCVFKTDGSVWRSYCDAR